MLSHIVGTGVDCTVRELAETLCRVIAYKGELVFDTGKPVCVDRRLALGSMRRAPPYGAGSPTAPRKTAAIRSRKIVGSPYST